MVLTTELSLWPCNVYFLTQNEEAVSPTIRIQGGRTEEILPRLKALVALTEDPGPVPSTQMVVYIQS